MLKNRKGLVAVLLAVFVVGTIIGLLCARPGLAADPVAANKVVKWEYAKLGESIMGGSRYTFLFAAGTRPIVVVIDDFKGFAKKLGVTGDATYPAIFSVLGGDGWELFMIERDVSPETATVHTEDKTYYFKRPSN